MSMETLNRQVQIRRLPTGTINRIAAGEVIERPAAVVRELVDNALDAGAKHIHIDAENGGMARIQVADDGHGMRPQDLELAIERHATSKLDAGPEPDLLNITSLGFRGEALPSIGAVSRLSIISRPALEQETHQIRVEGGDTHGPSPARWAHSALHGTCTEVRDLFYATPARLKFMKSERAETSAIADIVRGLAMSHPETGFRLTHNGRQLLALEPETGPDKSLQRLAAILGKDFAENAMLIDAEREGLRITGHAGLPTLNRSTARHQYLFVNDRPVKDRLLTGVVRAAYQDFLARDRHPIIVLFLHIPPQRVDVNVHPAKTEVRFRENAIVRGLCIGALRHALAEAGHRASTTIAGAALGAARPASPVAGYGSLSASGPRTHTMPLNEYPMAPPPVPEASGAAQTPALSIPAAADPPAHAPIDAPAPTEPSVQHPLGAARAQLHETYILAQTADGIVIVDQHAAHERLVLETMKQQFAQKGVRRQALLIPEIIELDAEAASQLLSRAAEFLEFGLEIEPFGPGCIAVRATPALFGEMDVRGLVTDLADEIAAYGNGLALREKFAEITGNMACRSAIKAGRRLNGDEMNAVLRQMEATPYSGQCNHGRPTYVELKLADIERLFGRR